MLEIITKADELVKENNMLENGDFVVVGVSGGADSMLLLNYLIAKKEEYNLRILAANVEHGIRGEESLEDTRFVRDYCLEREIEFECLHIDAVNEAREASMSVEEYSRNRRYEFFASFNPDKVATAHNMSDNIETVLFRLSRGTSIKGCCGIPEVRGNIIRPLLTCTSEEIREACRRCSIPYREDSTNSSDDYSRNYIRHNVVPALEQLNPSFSKAMSRFIASANQDEQALEALADKCFDECISRGSLRISRLEAYSPAVVKRAIIRLFDIYGITLDELHLNDLYALTRKQGRYQVKGNVFALSDKHRLRVAVFEEKIELGSLSLDKKIVSYEDFLNNCELYKRQFAFFCDYDKIVGEIFIRSRDEGDSISPAGRGCTKTLKKLYNELKINVEDRANIPVICDDNGVIGIFGYCCDERVKLSDCTEAVLMLNINLED